jgi:phosphatidylserine/phosphatidylglycerophosphate/cardiolipin synthase-like enzyme
MHQIFFNIIDKYSTEIGEFLQQFAGLYSFVRYDPLQARNYVVRCHCIWWFIDVERGFQKRPDVDAIIQFSAYFPHIPIIIIYLHELGYENRTKELDMDYEMVEIYQYLNRTTGDNELGVVTIEKEKDVTKLLAVTRDLVYSTQMQVKWFASERNCQHEPYSDCNLKLYHDACHSLNGNNLFEDISDAFENAKRLILIMGWSLNFDLKLHRFDDWTDTLGEQLCRKAEQGVMVCIFLWQDVGDFMQTENALTKLKFMEKSSNVHVRLRMRKTALRQYSHHQKLIVSDGPDGLVAFCGGLDLTKGRFDTPSHDLFSTLNTVHADDYYNSIFDHEPAEGRPRCPWHDIHAQIQGDVVWDMLSHFRAHWLLDHKFYKKHETEFNKRIWKMITDLYPGNIEEVSKVSGAWTVQFFSSVTQGQLFRRRVSVNDGIMRAYVNAINNADKFIYIENQFFVGGSYHWLAPVSKAEKEAAPNVIPVLLVDKIITKIRDKEPFKVYIILPQMPDGKPSGVGTQGVLYYQFKTIEMMYHRLSSALDELGLPDKNVEDYLQFMCLGKVEWNPFSNRYERFMIYVHSKLMIVDDEYLIVGSANLNSRSLDGRRDSEICVGCAEANMNSGKIRHFRECLWMEHFGVDPERNDIHGVLEDTSVLFNTHYDPSHDRVFKKVKQFCAFNNQLFAECRPLMNMGRSHILKLPIAEDRKSGICRPRMIPEFQVSFGGTKPPRVLPLTLFT